jgi:hypothetical protein
MLSKELKNCYEFLYSHKYIFIHNGLINLLYLFNKTNSIHEYQIISIYLLL